MTTPYIFATEALTAAPYLTLRQAADLATEALNLKHSAALASCRAALQQLREEGTVVCWSKAKPMFVLAERAATLRAELKADILDAIAHGFTTSGQLKRRAFAGMCIGIDLMQDLLAEMVDEQLIDVVTTGGRGHIRVYTVHQGALPHIEVTAEMCDCVLGQLREHMATGKMRCTVKELISDAQPELTTRAILTRLHEIGLVQVTEVGHLQLYAVTTLPRIYAPNPVTIPVVRPLTDEECAAQAMALAAQDAATEAAAPALPRLTLRLRAASATHPLPGWTHGHPAPGKNLSPLAQKGGNDSGPHTPGRPRVPCQRDGHRPGSAHDPSPGHTRGRRSAGQGADPAPAPDLTAACQRPRCHAPDQHGRHLAERGHPQTRHTRPAHHPDDHLQPRV